MRLELIHDYIEAVTRYENREPGTSIAEHVLAMNIAWTKLNTEDRDEATRLCEIKRL
jgi:hypothetical protein